MDKTSPLEVGDRTKCNEVQGDDREKPTSTTSGGKTRLIAFPKNSQTSNNHRWSSPGLAVYAARRPSFTPVGGQVQEGISNLPKLFKPKFASKDFLDSLK